LIRSCSEAAAQFYREGREEREVTATSAARFHPSRTSRPSRFKSVHRRRIFPLRAALVWRLIPALFVNF